jgi:hypothetical protein
MRANSLFKKDNDLMVRRLRRSRLEPSAAKRDFVIKPGAAFPPLF